MKDDKLISEQAIAYIKKNKKVLFARFASEKICRSLVKPVSIFMAGAPGTGKTEFSKNFIKDFKFKAVRIDADDIREIIPQYSGNNSNIVQGAASLGVQKLFDYALKKKKNLILDGTFANFDLSCENVERSIGRGRPTYIFYIHQDPKIAWQFTKAREALEGRYVPKSVFVNSFFQSKANVNRLKMKHGADLKVYIIEKNFKNEWVKLYSDIDDIDNHIKIEYNKKTLRSIL